VAANASRIIPFRSSATATAEDARIHDGFDVTAEATADVLPSQERRHGAVEHMGGRPPRIVPVQDLGSDALRLVHPLHVILEESDGQVVAMSYDLEIAEDGETEFDALEQFRTAVIELYESLVEIGDDAPAQLRKKLSFLRSLAR
jgi:hypothetical protein